MNFLVVDDDARILEALHVGLQMQWPDAKVLTATNGEAALTIFAEARPDLVLLDVSMPRVSGYEVLSQIRERSDVPVIIMTARGEEIDQVRGLELGADDYVVKPLGLMALVARIKAVLRRTALMLPAEAIPDFVSGDLAVHFGDHTVTVAGEPVTLSPLEYRLLYFLVRNAGQLLPRQTLIDRVWGDYGISDHHLNVAVSRLRSKIEQPGDPPSIETRRGLGYRFVRRQSQALPQGQ